jgi:predicted sugar kinase
MVLWGPGATEDLKEVEITKVSIEQSEPKEQALGWNTEKYLSFSSSAVRLTGKRLLYTTVAEI